MKSLNIVYPSLYISADRESNKTQSLFLLSVKFEYSMFLSLSLLSAFGQEYRPTPVLVGVILLMLSATLLYKSMGQPTEKWYSCRALAESIKTSTWRYSMRAHPFNDAENVGIPTANFRNFLIKILKANKTISGSAIPIEGADANQISEEMMKIRNLPLVDRIIFYKTHRIKEQRLWYAKKARYNRRRQTLYTVIGLILYVFAFTSVFGTNLGFPEIESGFDPLLFLALSFIGWSQIKKHGELAASYTLTAHEIGIISTSMKEIENESEFSDFVNEAELAFSREHTQWIARRDVN